jgi:hypothetical protein
MLGLLGNLPDSDCDFLLPNEVLPDEERVFKGVEPRKLEVLLARVEVEYLVLGVEL